MHNCTKDHNWTNYICGMITREQSHTPTPISHKGMFGEDLVVTNMKSSFVLLAYIEPCWEGCAFRSWKPAYGWFIRLGVALIRRGESPHQEHPLECHTVSGAMTNYRNSGTALDIARSNIYHRQGRWKRFSPRRNSSASSLHLYLSSRKFLGYDKALQDVMEPIFSRDLKLVHEQFNQSKRNLDKVNA